MKMKMKLRVMIAPSFLKRVLLKIGEAAADTVKNDVVTDHIMEMMMMIEDDHEHRCEVRKYHRKRVVKWDKRAPECQCRAK